MLHPHETGGSFLTTAHGGVCTCIQKSVWFCLDREKPEDKHDADSMFFSKASTIK